MNLTDSLTSHIILDAQILITYFAAEQYCMSVLKSRVHAITIHVALLTKIPDWDLALYFLIKTMD